MRSIIILVYNTVVASFIVFTYKLYGMYYVCKFVKSKYLYKTLVK